MKAIHCTRYDGQNYFALSKQNNKLYMRLHCSSFEITKTYPEGTKFQKIYAELKTALGPKGYSLLPKYNQNNYHCH